MAQQAQLVHDMLRAGCAPWPSWWSVSCCTSPGTLPEAEENWGDVFLSRFCCEDELSGGVLQLAPQLGQQGGWACTPQNLRQAPDAQHDRQ